MKVFNPTERLQWKVRARFSGRIPPVRFGTSHTAELRGAGHRLSDYNFIILLHEKFLQFDWLRAVVFQLNLKYLDVKITKPLRVVV